MWDKIKQWGGGILAALAFLATLAGYLLRRRASDAQQAIGQAREVDAEVRGRDAADRKRSEVIDGELKWSPKPPRRTAGQVLEEQRRRGQVKE